ncbi:MAG: isocitrate lyase/phosphoenolpyruvate mutase family protein [Gammaproteobacteria bacterium]|nr:isocitrate lyase/phosphoenolpyruvate mutase family protein [Gammaproteobacteria bacterium]
MSTQAEKSRVFKALHDSNETFIIPNPWDAGSARVLQGLGFKALATTSAGFAQSLGKLDGQVSVDEKIEHCRALCAVTDIPVSADFENGFTDSPAEAAANILRVAEAGVVGASIEDYSGTGIYDFSLAVDRIAACAKAVAQLSFPFILTARAENLLRGVDDLDDTIKRLQAFETAGADVLYAPGLRNLDQVRQIVDSVTKPVNVLSSFMPDVTLDQYAKAGVGRVSIGGALANHAIGSTMTAARQMLDSGDFGWVKNAAPGGEIRKLLDPST